MAQVIIIKRTSTNHQDLSIEAQDTALRKWCEAHGHTVKGESTEIAVSGSKKIKKRSQAMKLVNNLAKGDILAVYSLSRLTRSLADLMAIAEILQKKEANLVSLTEQIDTTSPSGRLFFHIMGSLYQFERELIAQRVKFGLDHKRSKGEKLGGLTPLGFDVKPLQTMNRKGEPVTVKTLIPNQKDREIIDTILDLRAKKYTQQQIADVLNAEKIPTKHGSVWMQSQVHNVLKKEAVA